ncbi:MAG: hypothetical protein ACYCX3_12375 [Thermoleophilia bacterium]
MANELTRRYRVDEAAVRDQERALALTAGRLGGAELRPTRVFVWLGDRVGGREWVLPMGPEPRLLRASRRRRHLDLGACHLSFLGNPAVTVGLLVYHVARKATRRDETPRPPAP